MFANQEKLLKGFSTINHFPRDAYSEYSVRFCFGVTKQGTYSSQKRTTLFLNELMNDARKVIPGMNRSQDIFGGNIDNARCLMNKDGFYLVTYGLDQVLQNVQNAKIVQLTNIREASSSSILENFMKKHHDELYDLFLKQIKYNKATPE